MIRISVKPAPQHEISPYLYMQFMEPLGVSDSSVDAAWDFVEEKWQDKVIEKARELAPTMVRFGGCFASYYHWMEAVGPQKNRVPMKNHLWGGVYLNQVGTHEFAEFCRRVEAEPLVVVNMESEGYAHWQHPKNDTDRTGTAEEAAAWVRYCNDPEDALRISHGVREPYNVKYWQLGNETSYSNGGALGFTSDEAAEATRRFAAAMRKADPSIRLIAWGDETKHYTRPEITDRSWCRKMAALDGIDMIAFHHHFDSGLPDSVLREHLYRKDPDATWQHFMYAHNSLNDTILRMRANRGAKRLAMTEGHFSFPGKNRGTTLCTWAAGAAYARCHNVIMRHSDVLDIATLADFFGNTWQSNAIMIPAPINSGEAFLMPVGTVMSLFGHHQGKFAAEVRCSGDCDVVASVTGNTVFLHVQNTDMHFPREIRLEVEGRKIKKAVMYCIDANPMTEISSQNPHVFDPKTVMIEGDTVILPPAAAAAVEIET